MGTKTWTGSGDGTTFMSAGNWSGGLPQNDDTLIINTGSDAIAGAATGLTGITLRVTTNFTGTIGSSTTYLDMNGPNCIFESGGPEAYLTGEWTNMRITGGAPTSDFLSLKGSSDTVIGTLISSGLRGTITINSSATVTTIFATGERSGTIDIKNGVTNTSISVANGVVLTASSATTIEVLDGDLTVSGTAAVTTLEIDGGGTVNYLSSGTIGTLTVFDGIFDAQDNDSTTFTITNSTVHKSGVLGLDSSFNNVVLTNPCSMLGGEFRAPIGSTISLT